MQYPINFHRMPTLKALFTPDVPKLVKAALVKAVKELLENKTLYQSVLIDVSGIEAEINKIKATHPALMHRSYDMVAENQRQQQPYRLKLNEARVNPWAFSTEYFIIPEAAAVIEGQTIVDLPTIHVNCANCDSSLPPHNAGYRVLEKPIPSLYFGAGQKGGNQVFSIPYHCQSCKSEPLMFMVRREGFKLTLVGRSHLKLPDIPKFIPKNETPHFRDALIAKEAGQILPALFMLRVFVEQYMRRVIKADGRITGDELGDSYAKLLDADFPKRPVSLKVIYSELSECLHAANPSVQQFDKSKQDLITHFDHLRLTPLTA